MANGLTNGATAENNIPVTASSISWGLDPALKKAIMDLFKISIDMKRLTAQVQTVPQEIYDLIFEYTFLADRTSSNAINAPPKSRLPDNGKEGVTIDANYKPPALLHISQGRPLFAASYYSNTCFHVTSRDTLIKWLRSLPLEHAKLLTEVRYHIQIEDTFDGSWQRKVGIELILAQHQMGDEIGIPHDKGIIYARMHESWSDQWWWHNWR